MLLNVSVKLFSTKALVTENDGCVVNLISCNNANEMKNPKQKKWDDI